MYRITFEYQDGTNDMFSGEDTSELGTTLTDAGGDKQVVLVTLRATFGDPQDVTAYINDVLSVVSTRLAPSTGTLRAKTKAEPAKAAKAPAAAHTTPHAAPHAAPHTTSHATHTSGSSTAKPKDT